MKKGQWETDLQTGAENETRTRDPDLGKVVLYQLSYFRDLISKFFENNFIFRKVQASLRRILSIFAEI